MAWTYIGTDANGQPIYQDDVTGQTTTGTPPPSASPTTATSASPTMASPDPTVGGPSMASTGTGYPSAPVQDHTASMTSSPAPTSQSQPGFGGGNLSTIGAGVGFMAGGPMGAAAGAVIGGVADAGMSALGSEGTSHLEKWQTKKAKYEAKKTQREYEEMMLEDKKEMVQGLAYLALLPMGLGGVA